MDEGRKGRLQDELEKLEQMRDELRLQAHLFKADMKEETLEDVGEATGLLIDSVFDGFKRLRDSLK